MEGIRAASGLGIGVDWRQSVTDALQQVLQPLEGEAPDLVVLFASAAYQDDFAEMLREVLETTQATHLIGSVHPRLLLRIASWRNSLVLR